jgi:hypothetical protein
LATNWPVSVVIGFIVGIAREPPFIVDHYPDGRPISASSAKGAGKKERKKKEKKTKYNNGEKKKKNVHH